jgi:hypothetical protein
MTPPAWRGFRLWGCAQRETRAVVREEWMLGCSPCHVQATADAFLVGETHFDFIDQTDY